MKYTPIKLIPMPKEVTGKECDGIFTEIMAAASIYTNVSDFYMFSETFIEYVERVHGLKLEFCEGGIKTVAVLIYPHFYHLLKHPGPPFSPLSIHK